MDEKQFRQTFFTVREVARYLHVKPETVQHYIREGRLDAKRPGRNYLIAPDDLAAFIQRGKA